MILVNENNRQILQHLWWLSCYTNRKMETKEKTEKTEQKMLYFLNTICWIFPFFKCIPLRANWLRECSFVDDSELTDRRCKRDIVLTIGFFPHTFISIDTNAMVFVSTWQCGFISISLRLIRLDVLNQMRISYCIHMPNRARKTHPHLYCFAHYIHNDSQSTHKHCLHSTDYTFRTHTAITRFPLYVCNVCYMRNVVRQH